MERRDVDVRSAMAAFTLLGAGEALRRRHESTPLGERVHACFNQPPLRGFSGRIGIFCSADYDELGSRSTFSRGSDGVQRAHSIRNPLSRSDFDNVDPNDCADPECCPPSTMSSLRAARRGFFGTPLADQQGASQHSESDSLMPQAHMRPGSPSSSRRPPSPTPPTAPPSPSALPPKSNEFPVARPSPGPSSPSENGNGSSAARASRPAPSVAYSSLSGARSSSSKLQNELAAADDKDAASCGDPDHGGACGHSHGGGSAWISRFPAIERFIDALRTSLKASLASAVLFGVALLCPPLLRFLAPASPLATVVKFVRTVALGGVFFLAGLPSLVDTIGDVLQLPPNVNVSVLMTVAAFLSLFMGNPVEGALLLVLFSVSAAAEEEVTRKARMDVRSVQALAPRTGWVVDHCSHGGCPYCSLPVEKPVEQIRVGDYVVVKAGERVPVDGVVSFGTTSVDLAHLTGESLPVLKTLNDEVPAGARVVDGFFTLKAVRTSSDSAPARLARLTADAFARRPRLQRLMDEFGGVYAKAILGFSMAFAAAAPFLLKIPFLGSSGSLYRALGFLVAASPCALVIAASVPHISAISACAREGLLLKGGYALDSIARCSAVAFDKTGTLTTGELCLTSIEPLPDDGSMDAGPSRGAELPSVDPRRREFSLRALDVAAALERTAVHPIARAVLARHAMEYGVQEDARDPSSSEDSPQPATPGPAVELRAFRSVPGYGLEAEARVGERWVPCYFGTVDYALRSLPDGRREALRRRADEARDAGGLVSALLVGTEVTLFHFVDAVRPTAAMAVSSIRRRLASHALSGAPRSSARKVAAEVGIDEYHADLKPEDKLAWIERIHAEETENGKREGGLVMVGDGINDGPSLARADVGISVGKFASATAVSASDGILIHEELLLVDWLIAKARACRRIMMQNIAFALCTIFMASMPALAGRLPLWLAVTLHEGGTVLVGLNSLRLLAPRRKPKRAVL
eukprot:tig00000241_g21027.t1